MHPAALAILLHRALEVRLARLQELLGQPHWADDTERLHQVRVAARRLGAVLDLVDLEIYPNHKSQRRALKELVDTLGLPRELDVHAGILRTYLAGTVRVAHAASIEHVLVRVDRDRAKARRNMTKSLKRLRLPDLDRLLEVPTLPDPFQPITRQEGAWACLEPRAEAALGGLAALTERENPSAMHKARVRIKKLRYAVEALEAAFLDPPEACLKDLRNLQTLLGDHHDLAVLEDLLWTTEAGLRAGGHGTLGEGTLDLLGEVAEDRRALFGRFVQAAEGLNQPAFTGAMRPLLGLDAGGSL